MTKYAALIEEARQEAVPEILDGGYVAWDQDEKLGKPPYAKESRERWEQAHGHDVRLKCYPEFGCQVTASYLALLTLRLADALEAAEARNAELEQQVQELIWEAKENG